jgi:two-component system response regulator YesN
MIKVVIVDDEKKIREGIIHLIDWAELGCEVVMSCANASMALDYFKTNEVDIVVTDIKMPVMDGIELSRRIRDDYSGVKVVILTAYSDFSLAQQAIKSNVVDFIVKNDFIEELPVVIQKLVKSISEEKEKYTKQMLGDDEGQYYQSIFRELIESDESCQAQLYLSRLESFHFFACACEIDNYDKDTSKRGMTGMLNEILKISLEKCGFNLIPITDTFCMIIIRYVESESLSVNDIINYFNNIIIMVEQFMRIDIRFGISQKIEHPEKIKEACEQATESLSRIDEKGCQIRVYTQVQNEENIEISSDVDTYMTRICELTFEDDNHQANDLLVELYDKLKASSCTFQQCQLYMLVICSSILHKAMRYQIDIQKDFNDIEKEIYTQIQSARTTFGLMNIGTDTINRFWELCRGKQNFKNELVKRVNECIRNNYKEELTLQFISQELYLNSSYLSRAFKKLTGVTITEKITLCRVEKAKELLSNSSMKVYEVAQEVGIRDASYFTNVFMKYVGESPTEYRQKHG